MYLSLNINMQDAIFGFEVKSRFSVSCVIPYIAIKHFTYISRVARFCFALLM